MARRSNGPGVPGVVLALLVVGALVSAAETVTHWISRHEILTIMIGTAIVAAVASTIAVVIRSRRAAAERLAELERNIATADGLSGPDFEQWTARLMRRTGFSSVAVCGRTGDQGADITAYAPDGRYTVVQCKRFAPDRAVGAPEVYKFGGTAQRIHGAQLAVMIATTRFTRPAWRDADTLDVVLIDRDRLAAWATDQIPPREINDGPIPAPAA
jgi:restriction system protein